MLKQAGGIIGFIHGTGLKLPKVTPMPSGFIGTLVKTFKDAYRLAKHPKKPVGFNAHVTEVKSFK